MAGEPMQDESFLVAPDDELRYSEDPELSRQYWLDLARYRVGSTIQDLRKRAAQLTGDYEEIRMGRVSYAMAIPNLSKLFMEGYSGEVEGLLDEMRHIAEEKGFRYSILTPREHQEIGSSGYGGIYWEADPDIPVSILFSNFVAEGTRSAEDRDSDILTVEEVDRARRLQDMTKLDPITGRVTDEIDDAAAADPYYFVPPERKVQMQTREQEILDRLQAIADQAIADYEPSTAIVDDIAAYMEGQLTSPQMNVRHQELLLDKGELVDLSEAIREAKQLAFETGKWDRILTPQEILLRESAQLDPRYLNHPYIPLGIQDGNNPEAIAALRQGEEFMVVTTGIMGYAMPFGFRLEEIDKEGKTQISPAILDRISGEELSDESKGYFVGKIDFPFARPEDWFYKPEQTA